MRRIFLIVFAISLFSAAGFWPVRAQQPAVTGAGRSYDVVLTVPVGPSGVQYSIDRPETEKWGPAAFRIASDGSFLITDSVGRRVLRYKADGTPLPTIPVANVRSLTDVTSDGAEIAVLDGGAQEPKIVRLRMDGLVFDTIPLSDRARQLSVTGLHHDNGELVLDVMGGLETATTDGVKHTGGARVSGRTVAAATPDLDARGDHSTATITVGTARMSIRVNQTIGGVRVLGVAPAGDVYVLVDELADTGVLRVDQTVRRFSPNGDLVGVARVPLAERTVYVPHGVAMNDSGDVFALITRRDSVDIVRLRFARSQPTILPKSTGPTFSTPDASALTPSALATTACRSVSSMTAAANTYVNYQRVMTSANLTGACAGRKKPVYLGTTAGTYFGFPYDWGGSDSVSAFSAYMSSGYQAGDVDTANPANASVVGTEACSRGVDCSGFVSNVWDTGRYTTNTLDSISMKVGRNQLMVGDIILKKGSHVAIFNGLAPNGLNTVEAVTNSYDRVVAIWNDWTRFANYDGYYRYKNVCTTTLIGTTAPLYAKSTAQSVSLTGTALTNVLSVDVTYPNGGGVSMLPSSLSVNQVSVTPTLATRGTYKFQARTSAGWTNIVTVVVN